VAWDGKKSVVFVLQSLPMEEVVMVDLDSGECHFFQADVAAIPHTPLKALRRQLAAALTVDVSREVSENPRDLRERGAQQEGELADAMLRFFVHLLGSYGRHVRPVPSSSSSLDNHNASPAAESLTAAGLQLDHAAFVAARVTSSRTRAFLDMMRQTQMYEVWVRERLGMLAEGGSDDFERRASSHESQSSQRVKAQLESGLMSMRHEMKSMASWSQSTWSTVKEGVKEGTQRLTTATASPSGATLQVLERPVTRVCV